MINHDEYENTNEREQKSQSIKSKWDLLTERGEAIDCRLCDSKIEIFERKWKQNTGQYIYNWVDH